ncbi:MAG: TlpA disulfide reductase family protein, partial [Allomuricauda sp.]
MKHLLFSLVFVAGLMVSCGEKPKEKGEETTSEQAYAKVEKEKDVQVKFPIYDYEGLKPLLNKDDGKTYIINFWATWCKPCIEELPYFEKVYAEQKANKVEVVLVSLDMPSMWKSRLDPFVENKELQSQVVILDDPKQNEWIPKIDES